MPKFWAINEIFGHFQCSAKLSLLWLSDELTFDLIWNEVSLKFQSLKLIVWFPLSIRRGKQIKKPFPALKFNSCPKSKDLLSHALQRGIYFGRFYFGMFPAIYSVTASLIINRCPFPVLGHQPHLVLSNQNIPKSKSDPIIRKAPTISEVVTFMNEEWLRPG